MRICVCVCISLVMFSIHLFIQLYLCQVIAVHIHCPLCVQLVYLSSLYIYIYDMCVCQPVYSVITSLSSFSCIHTRLAVLSFHNVFSSMSVSTVSSVILISVSSYRCMHMLGCVQWLEDCIKSEKNKVYTVHISTMIFTLYLAIIMSLTCSHSRHMQCILFGVCIPTV